VRRFGYWVSFIEKTFIRQFKKGFRLISRCLRLEALYLEEFKNPHQYDLFSEKRMILDKLQEEGFISIHDGHLNPTPTGLAVADSLSLI
jgi:superfamily II helicase